MRMSECHPDRPNVSLGLCDSCRLKRDYHKRKAKLEAWKASNPDKVQLYSLKHRLKKYDIPLKEYMALLDRSEHCCHVCGKKALKPYSLHIDHNHVTGKVRGLLCNSCNLVLGLVRDQPHILYSLIGYLKAEEQ
jgi:hypothetical protein